MVVLGSFITLTAIKFSVFRHHLKSVRTFAYRAQKRFLS